MAQETGKEVMPVSNVADNTEYLTNHHGGIQALAEYEEEPETPYQLSWRTILAVLALSMGNCCAALTNTVSNLIAVQAIWPDNSPADQYYHPLSSNGNNTFSKRRSVGFMDWKWQFHRCARDGSDIRKYRH